MKRGMTEAELEVFKEWQEAEKGVVGRRNPSMKRRVRLLESGFAMGRLFQWSQTPQRIAAKNDMRERWIQIRKAFAKYRPS